MEGPERQLPSTCPSAGDRASGRAKNSPLIRTACLGCGEEIGWGTRHYRMPVPKHNRNTAVWTDCKVFVCKQKALISIIDEILKRTLQQAAGNLHRKEFYLFSDSLAVAVQTNPVAAITSHRLWACRPPGFRCCTGRCRVISNLWGF